MIDKPVIFDVETIKTLIPHRYPLLLVENVHELDPQKRILASYRLKETEPVFEGHFPGTPVYPGVYFIESIAQAGAILVFETRKHRGLLNRPLGFLSTVEKARFRKTAGPNDLLMFDVELIKDRKSIFFWLHGKVFVGDTLIAEASLSVALGDK